MPVNYETLNVEQNRLRWRCHRGMRELDIVFGRFLDHEFEQLDPAQRANFAALLDTSDPDLYAWLLQRDAPPPAEFKTLITLLRRYQCPA